MNKLFPLILLLSLAFVACDKKEISPDTHSWGTFKRFSDFPIISALKPYQPDTLFKTLRFEFNHHSIGAINNVNLQLVERVIKRNDLKTDTKETVYSIPKGVLLLKDGVRCEDNILTVTPQDAKIQVGIVFTNETEIEDRSYTFVLKVLDSGGLDRIGNTDVSAYSGTSVIYLADEWVVKMDKVWNPLVLILFLIGIFIVTFLVLWYLLSRQIFNPTNRFSKIYFSYCNGEEEVHRVGNCYKVVCTSKKTPVSLFHKFFVGNVAFEVNDFWQTKVKTEAETEAEGEVAIEVEIKSKKRNELRVLVPFGFQIDPFVAQYRREPFIITKPNGQTVTIQTS